MSIFKSAIWDFGARVFNYLTTFAVSILLTRILMPEDFGAFGIILAISVFAWVVIEFGFKSAIVQAASINQTQLSTVFFVNLLFGALLAVSVAAVGPLLERTYAIKGLALYVLGVAPVFFLNGLFIVPSALLQRDLRLKEASIVSVISSVASGSLAVTMAMNGLGVWSLVASNVLSAAIATVLVSLLIGWAPSREFQLSSIKPLFEFGYRLFLSTILDVVFTRADVFIIGKLFDVATLGFYTRAQSLDQQVRMFSVSTIVTVMLPYFARFQNELDRLREAYIRSLHFVCFLTVPAAALMALVARDLFVVLFTEKWAISAEYFRIIAISSATYPLSILTLNLISGKGNSKKFLRLEMTKKAFLLPAYLSFVFGGIITFLVSMAVLYTLSLAINMVAVDGEIGAGKRRQAFIVVGYSMLALVSAAGAYFSLTWIELSPLNRLFISSVIFGSIYMTLNWAAATPGCREFISRFIVLTGLKNEERAT